VNGEKICKRAVSLWVAILSALFVPATDLVFIVIFYVPVSFSLYLSLFLAFPFMLGAFWVGKRSAQDYRVHVKRAIREKDKKTISYYSMVGYVFKSVPQVFLSPIASVLFIAYFFPFPLVLFGISTTAVSLFTGIFYYALERAKNISQEIEGVMMQPRAPKVEKIKVEHSSKGGDQN